MSLKSKLRNGCLIQYRDESRAIYFDPLMYADKTIIGFADIDSASYMGIHQFDEELKCDCAHRWDVMKIYDPPFTCDVVANINKEVPWTWQRKEKTQQEIEKKELLKEISRHEDKIEQLWQQYFKVKKDQELEKKIAKLQEQCERVKNS